jgi:hypothetical protein
MIFRAHLTNTQLPYEPLSERCAVYALNESTDMRKYILEKFIQEERYIQGPERYDTEIDLGYSMLYRAAW